MLAIGYQDNADGTSTVYHYDNNYPDTICTITIDFRNAAPAVESHPHSVRGPLMGFFCEAYSLVDPPAPHFALRPGAARDVAVGPDRSVWVIGTNPTDGGHGVWHWDQSNWTGVSGGAERITVFDGYPWVVNNAGQIWSYNGTYWARRPGAARDIGAGGGALYVIGTNPTGGGHGIYRWNGSNWTEIDGGAERIAVGPDGRPWVVNDLGQIWRRTAAEHWELVPGRAQDIAVGASPWVIGSNGTTGDFTIYRFDDNGNWVPVAGAASVIGAGPDNSPWVATSNGQIYGWTIVCDSIPDQG